VISVGSRTRDGPSMEILKDAHKRGRRNGETEGDKERRRGSWGGVFGGGHKRGVKRLNGGNCNGSRGFWAVFGWRSFFISHGVWLVGVGYPWDLKHGCSDSKS